MQRKKLQKKTRDILECYCCTLNMRSDQTAAFEDSFSGAVGATLKLAAGHPLETLKVRMQTRSTKYSFFRCFGDLYREGLGSFYKGIAPNIPAMMIYNSGLFAAQGWALDRFQSESLTIHQIAFSGAFAGTMASVCCSPLELIKIRLQTSKEPISIVGQLRMSSNILQSVGIIGMFRGVQLMVLREIPANALYFSCFESFLRYYGYSVTASRAHDRAPAYLIFAAGGLAGVANWIFVYPIDLIKSKYQASDSKESWISFTRRELKRPLHLLFQGYSACLLRGFVANAVTFIGVEYTRRFFQYFKE